MNANDVGACFRVAGLFARHDVLALDLLNDAERIERAGECIAPDGNDVGVVLTSRATLRVRSVIRWLSE